MEEGFHYVLKEALIQAQAEGLLDADVGQWSPAELQITAAALSLYFAALQARGSPPCITAPRPIESGMGSEQQAFVLSSENCPPSFASFFALWQVCVPRVQRLDLERRHDLALILCDQPPQSSPVHMEVAALARDIKVVALDIVQVSCMRASQVFSPLTLFRLLAETNVPITLPGRCGDRHRGFDPDILSAWTLRRSAFRAAGCVRSSTRVQ